MVLGSNCFVSGITFTATFSTLIALQCMKLRTNKDIDGLNPFTIFAVRSEKDCVGKCEQHNACVVAVYERLKRRQYCRFYDQRPEIFLGQVVNTTDAKDEHYSIVEKVADCGSLDEAFDANAKRASSVPILTANDASTASESAATSVSTHSSNLTTASAETTHSGDSIDVKPNSILLPPSPLANSGQLPTLRLIPSSLREKKSQLEANPGPPGLTPDQMWSSWTAWSDTCFKCEGQSACCAAHTHQYAPDTQRRSRQCLVYNQCQGEAEDIQPCPNVGASSSSSSYGSSGAACTNQPLIERPSSQWSNWQSWGSCSATCGNGMIMRARSCNNVGSSTCLGEMAQEMPCPGLKRCCTEWSSWSSCSQSCGSGGSYTRTRSCDMGSTAAIGSSYSTISQTESETQPCTEQSACPTWSEWTAFGSCSRGCGDGMQRRTRTCAAARCEGPAEETHPCNNGVCPEWNQWESWESCSATCGSGTVRRSRSCTQTGQCNGAAHQFQSCSQSACVGIWNDWGAWSTCSQNCQQTGSYNSGSSGSSTSAGVQTRTRSCSGAAECVGSSSDSQPCGTACSLIEQPASWGQWSVWSACAETCQTQSYGSNNGQSRQSRFRSCSLANQCTGQATESQACGSGACPLVQAPEWSTWSSWGTCSVSCGNAGVQTRRRFCTSTSEACPGLNSETQQCYLAACALAPSPSGYGKRKAKLRRYR